MKRLNWFKSKIGQRLYRNKINIDCCKHCDKVARNGLVVNDDMHANYLFDMEMEYNHCGHPLMYFETQKQAMNFEWYTKRSYK